MRGIKNFFLQREGALIRESIYGSCHLLYLTCIKQVILISIAEQGTLA